MDAEGVLQSAAFKNRLRGALHDHRAISHQHNVVGIFQGVGDVVEDQDHVLARIRQSPCQLQQLQLVQMDL